MEDNINVVKENTGVLGETNKKVIKEKKALIRIRNLKQYFPVKGTKNEFVKANDGITIDIYEGETLGIVGESGCGKSTLGRVLLQLYRQTDGETMYYGQSRDSLAPQYVLDTYKNLEKHSEKAKELIDKALTIEREYSSLEIATNMSRPEEAEALFKKKQELDEAKKIAHIAFLNVTEVVGGFYCVKDYARVTTALVKYYEECAKLRELNEQLTDLYLDQYDTSIGIIQDTSLSAPGGRIATHLEAIERQKLNAIATFNEVNNLRLEYKDDDIFMEYETYRDDGINLARLTYKEMSKLRNELQLIFQDPYSSLNPRFTVGQILGEGLLTHKYFKKNGKELQEYTMKVMEECGLQSYMINRYPHQFSGGQRQRIGIARSLAVKPKFVVCDEAVSALDVSIQSQIINLLSELKEKENLTYMFISHDLSVVKYISDRIAVMYLGNIVELAESAKIFANPLHPYTEALLAAIPTTENDKPNDMPLLEGDIPSPINPPKGCKFHTRCRHCMDKCKLVIPEFVEIEEGHFVACHYRSDN